MNDWKEWITKGVANKINLVFHTENFLQIFYLPFSLSPHLSSSFQNPHLVPRDLQFVNAFLHNYLSITIVMYHLLELQKKNFLINFWTRNTFSSYQFLAYPFKLMDAQFGKPDKNFIKFVGYFLIFCQWCLESFYEYRRN